MFQESQNDYMTGLQHSFFKKSDCDLFQNENCSQVQSFDLLGENAHSGQMEKPIDPYMKAGETLLSTRSTKKSDHPTCRGSYMPGSTSDYLFSGFFGQRNEDKPDASANNFYSVTNPFPMAEEDRRGFSNFKSESFNPPFDFMNSKTTNKKPKTLEENFNGSFIHNFSHNKWTKPALNTSYANNTSTSFNDLVKSVSLSSLKKKKVLSSEEMILEKMKKEKEEMQRLRSQNSQFAEKVKTYVSKPINPSPLTILKPFNLSSNNQKMLTKKRTNVEEINSKITEAMRKKCEGNTPQNPLEMIKLQKTPPNVKYMKKSLGRSRSKSPLKTEEDVQSLSSRIEKYCVISGRELNRSKSPSKNLFTENGVFNMHMSNILNTSKGGSNNSNVFSSSIRKHFGAAQLSTEEKIAQEMKSYKFKAKPLNKNIFNKRAHEVESFESVLQKTRMEKQAIDLKEKEDKKNFKIAQIKNNKFKVANKENHSQHANMKVEY